MKSTMKDLIIFAGLIALSLGLASSMTGCTQKTNCDGLFCKYQSINCENVFGYEDNKACFINEMLKDEFCKE